MSSSDITRLLQIMVEGVAVGNGTFKEPDVTFKTEADESHYVGIDEIVGLEALKAEISLNKAMGGILKHLEVCSGNRKRFIIRGSIEGDDCEPMSYKVTIEGNILEAPGSEMKGGKKLENKIVIGSIDYYEKILDGDQIWEIDRTNSVFVVDGVDKMAAHRINAGL